MSSESDRPLVTLAVSCFNHEPYILQAVESALAQDYSPLEIVFSDDASSDRTFALIEERVSSYRGDHIIKIHRNERNLGVGAHNNLLMEMSRGRLVVLAAGDDISEKERVTAVANAWSEDPDGIFCLASLATMIDASGSGSKIVTPYFKGTSIDFVELAKEGEAVLGATLAVSRKVFEFFGPLDSDINYCEDIVLPFRAALLGKLRIIDKSLVRYRVHPESLMGVTRPGAANSKKFVIGLTRILCGTLAARRQQLKDLELISGKSESEPLRLAAQYLKAHHLKSMLAVDLVGTKGGWKQLLHAVYSNLLTPKSALKLALMTKLPTVWFWYIKMRAQF